MSLKYNMMMSLPNKQTPPLIDLQDEQKQKDIQMKDCSFKEKGKHDLQKQLDNLEPLSVWQLRDETFQRTKKLFAYIILDTPSFDFTYVYDQLRKYKITIPVNDEHFFSQRLVFARQIIRFLQYLIKKYVYSDIQTIEREKVSLLVNYIFNCKHLLPKQNSDALLNLIKIIYDFETGDINQKQLFDLHERLMILAGQKKQKKIVVRLGQQDAYVRRDWANRRVNRINRMKRIEKMERMERMKMMEKVDRSQRKINKTGKQTKQVAWVHRLKKQIEKQKMQKKQADRIYKQVNKAAEMDFQQKNKAQINLQEEKIDNRSPQNNQINQTNRQKEVFEKYRQGYRVNKRKPRNIQVGSVNNVQHKEQRLYISGVEKIHKIWTYEHERCLKKAMKQIIMPLEILKLFKQKFPQAGQVWNWQGLLLRWNSITLTAFRTFQDRVNSETNVGYQPLPQLQNSFVNFITRNSSTRNIQLRLIRMMDEKMSISYAQDTIKAINEARIIFDNNKKHREQSKLKLLAKIKDGKRNVPL